MCVHICFYFMLFARGGFICDCPYAVSNNNYGASDTAGRSPVCKSRIP